MALRQPLCTAIGTTLAMALVTAPAAASAQSVTLARPQTTASAPPPQVTPPPVVPTLATNQPVQPVAPQVPLPVLNAAQMRTLTALLAGGGSKQGLRYEISAQRVPTDNDGLVRMALDYARAVHGGRLDTSDFDANWGLRPAAYDPLPAFAAAVAQDRLPQWFRGLPPPYAGYDGLALGLARYRAIAAAGGWATVAEGADLVPGAKGARVIALRKRLAVEDADAPSSGDTYDAALKEAVVRAQRRFGFAPTGVAGKETLAALNVPAEARVRQIMANMERWRWLPAELPKNRIQVNIAAAVLTVFDGDAPIMSMKGVTGRPGNETPMLRSVIHSVVINPPWNVPTGIAQKELWPKGAGYLARNGYKVITNPDGSKRLQQAAGTQSALGRFKFDFDNPYAVYLHDTPSRSKFSSFDRLASHGCVRVEKPAELAQLLLKDDPKWDAAGLQAAVDTVKTQRVPLPNAQGVDVYLLYWTAFASANGMMNFRADPYGWDGQLAAKIEKRSAIQAAIAR